MACCCLCCMYHWTLDERDIGFLMPESFSEASIIPFQQYFSSLLPETHTQWFLRLFWILSGTTWMSQYQKGKNQEGKTNLDLLEQEIVSGCDICWAICKSAPWPRCITMPASHHSVFCRLDVDALPAAQPTASKHWRHYLCITQPTFV